MSEPDETDDVFPEPILATREVARIADYLEQRAEAIRALALTLRSQLNPGGR